MFSFQVSPSRGTQRMQINFAYRPWVGPSAVTTLHISWSIHDDGGHFPTIRLRQSHHLTKCPAHSHINICSTSPPEFNRYTNPKIQQIRFTKVWFLQLKKFRWWIRILLTCFYSNVEVVIFQTIFIQLFNPCNSSIIYINFKRILT